MNRAVFTASKAGARSFSSTLATVSMTRRVCDPSCLLPIAPRARRAVRASQHSTRAVALFLDAYLILSQNYKVAVLGAAGGIGQPMSMLLKDVDGIKHLSLYDVQNTPGVAADLSHINTGAKVGTLSLFFESTCHRC